MRAASIRCKAGPVPANGGNGNDGGIYFGSLPCTPST
jgi:hypothetical protein